jgi:hypothetical protein
MKWRTVRMAIRANPRSSREEMSAPSADTSQQDHKASGGPLEAADFVASAVTDLAAMAHRHHLDTLGFLLDMARMEAEEVGRRQRIDSIR